MAAMVVSAAAAFCVVLLVSVLAGAHPAPLAVPQTTTSSTGSPSSCSTDLLRLLPCLPFIAGEAAVPPDTCCANLASMVHDEPACLCQALSPGMSPVSINMSRVLELPPFCRLDLPSASSTCAGLLPAGPTSSPPAISPRPGVNSTVSSTPVPLPATPPLATASASTSRPMHGYSSGSKLLIDGVSAVALGFMALASALAF